MEDQIQNEKGKDYDNGIGLCLDYNVGYIILYNYKTILKFTFD
jgi:hypothetical protein